MDRPPFSFAKGRTQALLRILETTDLHVHLMPYDYFADRPTARVGLTRTASLIRIMRGKVANCLLFDNGDFLQGSPLVDGDDTSAAQHPMMLAMNLLAYDAGTLGNHDFDGGLPRLREVLAQARFPLVLSNAQVRDDHGLHPVVPPYAMLHRHIRDAEGRIWPICIGVIGMAPPNPHLWDRFLTGDEVVVADIVETARRLVPDLRAAGAEIVVALCHSGIGPEQHLPGMENAAVPLAAVEGIDVVLAGHTHAVFPGPGWPEGGAIDGRAGTLHGKPAVMAGFHGSHLGVVDLLLEREEGKWHPIGQDVRALPITGTPDLSHDSAPQGDSRRALTDGTLNAAASGSHARALMRMRRAVGETAVELNSYFSRLAPDAALAALADSQRALAAELLTGTHWEGVPLLVAVAPARAGSKGGPEHFLQVAAGPLALRHVSAMVPHANALAILRMTGAGIAAWLERSASGFAQITPGRQDQPLFDADFAPYLADQIDGLTYEVDPSQPAQTDVGGRLVDPAHRRVSAIALNGRPLGDDEPVVLVTSSFRAGGGGGYQMAPGAPVLAAPRTTTREALLRLLAAAGPLRPAPRPGWRFRPLPGTGAWFDSAPAALGREGAVAGRLIRPLGPAPGGFLRFALEF